MPRWVRSTVVAGHPRASLRGIRTEAVAPPRLLPAHPPTVCPFTRESQALREPISIHRENGGRLVILQPLLAHVVWGCVLVCTFGSPISPGAHSGLWESEEAVRGGGRGGREQTSQRRGLMGRDSQLPVPCVRGDLRTSVSIEGGLAKLARQIWGA